MRRQFGSTIGLLAAMLIAGCGVGQKVADGTVDFARWAFTTEVKTMNLDLVSRAALNPSGVGQPLSTVVRIYQLKAPQTFEQLSYAQLESNDLELLKADVLATSDVVLRPDASVSLAEPMLADTEYVGVVALFRGGDKDTVWRLVVPKKQWKKTDPVKIEVRGRKLELA